MRDRRALLGALSTASSSRGRRAATPGACSCRLFAGALQATAGGAFATLLVQIGFVDPVGAAAAIAVTWLLLLPLPQRSRWGSCSA